MYKPLILVFCELNQEAAQAKAKELRTGLNTVLVRAVFKYGNEAEECSQILIMPDVMAEGRAELKRLYPNVEEVQSRPVPVREVAKEPAGVELPTRPVRSPRARREVNHN